MNVLILSVTAGQGHHQAGLAISSYFDKMGHSTTQVDCYEYLSPVIKETISNGYLMSTKYSPKLYGRFYRWAEKFDELEQANIISKITNTIFHKKMQKLIEEHEPAVIICTHVFAGVLVTYLREQGLLIPTIGIVTDFTIHPYWESTNLDYLVVANEFITPLALNKKIKEEAILPIGIPIFEKFATNVSKEWVRQELVLEDKDTILIMGGSMGFGNMLKNIKKIDKIDADFQLITVCGNNEKLKASIDAIKTNHKIYNFGFVSNVDVLMDASDCIVTKPGGLTTSEALAKEIPMIITKPIPGQEERNLDFLLNFGAGMRASKTIPIDEVISQLFLDNKKRDLMKSNIRLIKKPNAVKDLYEHVMKIIQ